MDPADRERAVQGDGGAHDDEAVPSRGEAVEDGMVAQLGREVREGRGAHPHAPGPPSLDPRLLLHPLVDQEGRRPQVEHRRIPGPVHLHVEPQHDPVVDPEEHRFPQARALPLRGAADGTERQPAAGDVDQDVESVEHVGADHAVEKRALHGQTLVGHRVDALGGNREPAQGERPPLADPRPPGLGGDGPGRARAQGEGQLRAVRSHHRDDQNSSPGP